MSDHTIHNPQSSEALVIGSKVKELVKAAGLRSDSHLVLAVSEEVRKMLGDAIARCQGNNRVTVRPYDL